MRHDQDRPAHLAKARAHCARQERSQQEVRDKLHTWSVPAAAVEGVISQLIAEGYLNEARFAEHFAVSKFRQKGWGVRKIEAALRQRQVSAPCIAAALGALDAEEYDRGLQQAVQRKWERLKEPDAFRKHQRLLRYFLGRGYGADAVERALRRCADME
jgi:regulatory protein